MDGITAKDVADAIATIGEARNVIRNGHKFNRYSTWDNRLAHVNKVLTSILELKTG